MIARLLILVIGIGGLAACTPPQPDYARDAREAEPAATPTPTTDVKLSGYARYGVKKNY